MGRIGALHGEYTHQGDNVGTRKVDVKRNEQVWAAQNVLKDTGTQRGTRPYEGEGLPQTPWEPHPRPNGWELHSDFIGWELHSDFIGSSHLQNESSGFRAQSRSMEAASPSLVDCKAVPGVQMRKLRLRGRFGAQGHAANNRGELDSDRKSA